MKTFIWITANVQTFVSFFYFFI